jgi:Icc-related predicted phosphoesterase
MVEVRVKLLLFSDIHNDRKTLERILSVEADYYISAGDQVSWARGLDRCGDILKTRGDRVWVLPGNHETDTQIAEMCARCGLNELHGRTFQAGPWTIAGLGYSSPTPFDTPGEYSETEIARRLQPFASLDPLVLVCHAPPAGTPLDQVRPGLHAGSTAVRGHIHEAEGVEAQIGRTRARNLGKKSFLLELD